YGDYSYLVLVEFASVSFDRGLFSLCSLLFCESDSGRWPWGRACSVCKWHLGCIEPGLPIRKHCAQDVLEDEVGVAGRACFRLGIFAVYLSLLKVWLSLTIGCTG